MSASVIGVTGLPCAGKSLASGILASGAVTGVPGTLVKADDVGHDVLIRPDVVARLREHFGDSVVGSDAATTRQRIARKVFNSPADLAWLESLVHPLVTAELDRAVAEAAGRRPVVVEAALLAAAGMNEKCDVIVVVEADFATRLRRAAGRGWDREELERRDRRLQRLFEPSLLDPDRKKLVYVRNDADDDGLAERLRAALSEKITNKTRKDRI